MGSCDEALLHEEGDLIEIIQAGESNSRDGIGAGSTS